MDPATKDQVGFSKDNGDRLSNQTHSMPSEWRFSGDLSQCSFNMEATDASILVFKEVPLESSSCPAVLMVDSFSSSIWDNHRTVDHNPSLKPVDLDCNYDTNAFAQSCTGIVSQSYAQFPADSGFIETTEKFSCFSGENFSDMINPFAISEHVSLHSKVVGGIISQTSLQTPLRLPCSSQSDKVCASDVDKCVLVVANQLMDQEDSTKKIDQKLANLLSGEEGRERIISSGNVSDNEKICGYVRDETSHLKDAIIEHSSKAQLKKKRKNTQGAQVVHNSSLAAINSGDDGAEYKDKGDPSETPSTENFKGKQSKDDSSSDAPKVDYIHVRARHGQATNSHSLAERVRREKISERMKFLQDLVPGCNKVTGKALMLDEIINYVQSLQHQVEFLSMKLATFTPSLDLKVESILPIDILQAQVIHNIHDINKVNRKIHRTQQVSIQTGTTGILDPSFSLTRDINSHLTAINRYGEIPSEIQAAWAGNNLHMCFSDNLPLDLHELNAVEFREMGLLLDMVEEEKQLVKFNQDFRSSCLIAREMLDCLKSVYKKYANVSETDRIIAPMKNIKGIA